MDMIRTENLTKRFGSITAVDGLSLSVAEGELFGLVGPDGAGKTTVMRLLASVMDPTSGAAWVAGKDIERESEAVKREIGYMSQRFGLYPDLTVMENLEFYADIYGTPRSTQAQTIGQLLEFSNLAPFKRRLAGNLSGGMKQKLGLACALIHTPKVLLLDEPTNGVDPVSRRDFWRILYRLLRDKVTIFVSTAYLDEAERFNRVAMIHQGRLIACGRPDALKEMVHGTLLEVRCSDPRGAVRALRPLLEGDSVGMFGDRIHILTPQRARAEQALRTVQIPFDSIRAIEPELEDVFVSLLSGGEGDSDAA